ncbi:unnamed protein product [Brassica oleracea var. botrytis]
MGMVILHLDSKVILFVALYLQTLELIFRQSLCGKVSCNRGLQ